ncbi:molecular chaperone Hsp20 [Mesorhizobium sp. Root157]|uniref:Hsp20 family protein n=1 Tax=Mesorhizobium sp. Root157 TaxID=1736477 RepID=UPI0006F93D33|nr:Hsp20 family protein [Mesorhizobium sp. Root157]KQZ95359.1 molecular chaperone Hsp20 [Mesorhizobium sp. Root157]
MRTAFDFSPLYRSSIGFDRVFAMLENASRTPNVDNWPPYDIARTGEDAYRITMVVAGFGQDELTIVHEPNLLIIAGEKTADDNGEYVHRGIAGRPFERRFELADHVKVTGACLVNGLLTIDLQREIPEEMKPRRIEIGSGQAESRIGTKTAKGAGTPVAEKQAA